MEILGLACLAALNPKLLALDLVFMGSRRPRVMFACFLIAGMSLALAVGLLDVFVVHADAIQTQGQVSASVDLVLGVPLLIVGVLLATDRLPSRRSAMAPASGTPSTADGWAHRLIAEPRVALALLIGLVVGTPGASYIVALHTLVTGKMPAAEQAIAVTGFVIVEFALVLIPFIYMALNPERAMLLTRRFKDWITHNARRIVTAGLLLAGGYMVISGILRLAA